MIEQIVEIGLTNAVVVAVLAGAVFLAMRVWRHPAIAHFLWSLVLLKLFVPPLLELPLAVLPANRTTMGTSDEITGTENESLFYSKRQLDRKEHSKRSVAIGPHSEIHAVTDSFSKISGEFNSERSFLPESEAFKQLQLRDWPWNYWVFGIWALGSLVFLYFFLLRIIRFQRLLHRAELAPAWLQHEADQLSERFGFRRAPLIRITNGKLPPLIWGWGRRATLLLPHELVAELSRQQRETLIAHELAHLRRNDHWVVFLELAALVIYWWHPVVWLVRDRLRLAAEECSDAWVVQQLPGQAVAYAETLMKVVDFLAHSAEKTSLFAHSISYLYVLERRFEMILNDQEHRQFSGKVRFMAVSLAVMFLAISPLMVRGEDDKAKPDKKNIVKEGEIKVYTPSGVKTLIKEKKGELDGVKGTFYRFEGNDSDKGIFKPDDNSKKAQKERAQKRIKNIFEKQESLQSELRDAIEENKFERAAAIRQELMELQVDFQSHNFNNFMREYSERSRMLQVQNKKLKEEIVALKKQIKKIHELMEK